VRHLLVEEGKRNNQNKRTNRAIRGRKEAVRPLFLMMPVALLSPEADSLIVCKLDCGDKNEAGEAEEPRTVVAGLAGKIPFDKLTNRKVVKEVGLVNQHKMHKVAQVETPYRPYIVALVLRLLSRCLSQSHLSLSVRLMRIRPHVNWSTL